MTHCPFPPQRSSFPNEEGEKEKCHSESWDPLQLANKRPPLARGADSPRLHSHLLPPPPHLACFPKRCHKRPLTSPRPCPEEGVPSPWCASPPRTVIRLPEHRAPQHPLGPPGYRAAWAPLPCGIARLWVWAEL